MFANNLVQNLVDNIKGWFEFARAQRHEYKYIIEKIELKQFGDNNLCSMIHYKMVGIRAVRVEKALDLNASNVFASFRPDHAQIIVSIATVESLLNKNSEEIREKYENYVKCCSSKIIGRNKKC